MYLVLARAVLERHARKTGKLCLTLKTIAVFTGQKASDDKHSFHETSNKLFVLCSMKLARKGLPFAMHMRTLSKDHACLLLLLLAART